MNTFDIPYIICSVLAFVPAVVLHEIAHGFAAYRLGDSTAKAAGRLSLNPLKHVDPFGTVLLPLLLLVAGGPVFGYAKPVPYNPRYFKDPRKGDLVVSLAGPAANLAMALVGALLSWALIGAGSLMVTSVAFYYFYFLFLPTFILVNLYFMFFNLLPIPPLDGSSIIALFVPQRHLPKYYRVQQYALPVFFLVIILLPQLTGINPVGIYLDATAYNLFALMSPLY